MTAKMVLVVACRCLRLGVLIVIDASFCTDSYLLTVPWGRQFTGPDKRVHLHSAVSAPAYCYRLAYQADTQPGFCSLYCGVSLTCMNFVRLYAFQSLLLCPVAKGAFISHVWPISTDLVIPPPTRSSGRRYSIFQQKFLSFFLLPKDLRDGSTDRQPL